MTAAQQADGVDLEAVTHSRLGDSSACSEVFEQEVQVFSQVRRHLGCHFANDSSEQKASGPRGGVDGEVALTQRNPSRWCDGPRVVDLQFGDDHRVDGTTRAFTV